MKVLMVNKFLHPAGGAETYVFRLGEQLTKLGHRVEYFGMDREDRIVGNRWEIYTKSMDFHSGNPLGYLSYAFKIIYSAEAHRKMLEILRKYQPDLIHINNFNYQLTPSILTAIQKYDREASVRPRVIFTAHDYQLMCPNHMFYRPAEHVICEACARGRFGECTKHNCIHNSKVRSICGSIESRYWHGRHIYDRLDGVICPSAFMAEKFEESGLVKAPRKVLCNFVNLPERGNAPTGRGEPLGPDATDDNGELLKSDAPTGCGESLGPDATADNRGILMSDAATASPAPYILYFGRYSVEKGLSYLLEAVKELPEIPVILAGGGPLEEEINREIRAFPHINNVGFLHGEELQRMIRGARFTVYPSHWYENCPFSVLESLMYGTPVLGSRRGGIPELIREGETGELYEPGNKEDLKRQIRTMWEDEERIRRYRENLKDIAFDTVETYTEKLLEFCEGL